MKTPGTQLREQMTVWDAEGERVGRISALGEHRFFISHDPALSEYEASMADVADVRDNDCFLNIRRAALHRAGPPGDEGPEENEPPMDSWARTTPHAIP